MRLNSADLVICSSGAPIGLCCPNTCSPFTPLTFRLQVLPPTEILDAKNSVVVGMVFSSQLVNAHFSLATGVFQDLSAIEIWLFDFSENKLPQCQCEQKGVNWKSCQTIKHGQICSKVILRKLLGAPFTLPIVIWSVLEETKAAYLVLTIKFAAQSATDFSFHWVY